MTPSRRRFLAGLCPVAFASLGGCLGSVGRFGDGSGSEDGENGGVTVHDVTVRPAVVALDSPDSYGVYGDRNEQYLIADVETADPGAYPADEFAIETPDGTHPATAGIGEDPWSLPGFGDAYGLPESDPAARGWIAVPLSKPLSGAEDARLVRPDGEHALPEAARARLVRPPTDFEVSFEAPESVSIGGTVTARVTVSNVGDVDGTFVAALNRRGPRIAYAPAEAIAISVPAGEIAVRKFEFPVSDPEIADLEDPSMRLDLRWRDGDRTRETTIEAGGSA
jgi:hypothetical protein